MSLDLRRTTSGGRFVPEIDGLRFVAIASVVMCHVYAILDQRNGIIKDTHSTYNLFFALLGRRGVPLFFVISGFILGVPFAAHYLCGRAKVSLRSYFLRRLTRLEPPYILNLLIIFALLLLTHRFSFQTLWPHLAANILYLHNLIFGPNNTVFVNGVAWSLEVEVQFYVLVPILVAFFAIKKKAWRRASIVLAIFLSWLFQFKFPSPYLHLTLAHYLQYFLSGFLLADVYLTDWREQPQVSYWWDVVSICGWPLVFYRAEIVWDLILPFLMLALYMAAFRGVVFRKLFRHPAITSLGGMCYSIYLFHFPIMSNLCPYLKSVHIGNGFIAYIVVQAAVTVPFVLIFCTAYFVLIERPCMQRDWPQRLLARVRQFRNNRLGKEAESGDPEVPSGTNYNRIAADQSTNCE